MAKSSTSFAPGRSGNPGGRPKVAREIRELAQTDAKTAYAKVKAIAEDDGNKQQLAAALAILKAAGVSLSEDKSPDPEPPEEGKPLDKTASTDELMAAAAKGEA